MGHFSLFLFSFSLYAHSLQQVHTTSGGLPAQSDTSTPRFPGGSVVLRFAQTSAGMVPVKSVSLRNAIPKMTSKVKEEKIVRIFIDNDSKVSDRL